MGFFRGNLHEQECKETGGSVCGSFVGVVVLVVVVVVRCVWVCLGVFGCLSVGS